MSETTSSRIINWKVAVITTIVVVPLAIVIFTTHRYQMVRLSKDLLRQVERHESNADHQKAIAVLSQYLEVYPKDVEQAKRAADLVHELAENSGRRADQRAAVTTHFKAINLLEDYAGSEEKKNIPKLRVRLAEHLLAVERFVDAREQAEAAGDAHAAAADRIIALTLYREMLKGGEQYPSDVSGKLKTALESNPGDIELVSSLARTQLRDGLLSREEQVKAAEECLHEISKIDTADAYILRYQIRTFYASSLPKSEHLLDLSRALKKDENHFVALVYLAQERAAVRDFDEALKILDRAERSQPESPIPYLLKSEVFRLQNAPLQMVKTLTRGIEQLEQSPWHEKWQLRVQLAHAYILQGKAAEAASHIKTLETALKKGKANLGRQSRISLENSLRLVKARDDVVAKRFEEATVLLDQVINTQFVGHDVQKDSATRAEALYLRGFAELQSGNRAAAINSWEEALQTNPMAIHARQAIFRALDQANEWKDLSQQVLRAIRVTNDVDELIRLAHVFVNSESKVQPGNRDLTKIYDVARKIGDALKSSDNESKLGYELPFIEARAHLLASLPEDIKRRNAIAVIHDRAKSLFPDTLLFWSKAVSALESLGDKDGAERALKEVKRLANSSTTFPMLAATLMRQRGSHKEALSILRQATAVTLQAEQLPLRQGLIKLHMELGDFERAAETCQETLKLFPKEVSLAKFMFENACQSGDLKSIAQWRNNIAKIAGERHREAIAARVRANLFQDSEEKRKAISRDLASLEKSDPKWGGTSFVKGLALKKQGDIARATEAFQQAYKQGLTTIGVYENLLEGYYRTGNFDAARSLVRRLGSSVSESAELSQLSLFEMTRLGDYTRTKQLARAVARQRPNDPRAWMWIAQAISREHKGNVPASELNEALAAIEKAVSIAPDELPIRISQALLFISFDKVDAARKVIQQILNTSTGQSSEAQAVAHVSIAECYKRITKRTGDGNDAKRIETHLRLAADVSENPKFRRRLAVHLAETKPKEAYSIFEHLIEETNDVNARLEYAHLLARTRTKDSWNKIEATLTSEDIQQKDKNIARLQLGVLAARQGQFDKAISLYKEVEKSPQTTLLLARWCGAAEKNADALRHWEELLKVHNTYSYRIEYIRFLIRSGNHTAAEKEIQRHEKLVNWAWPIFALKAELLNAQDKKKALNKEVEQYISRVADNDSGARTVAVIQTATKLDELKQFSLSQDLWKSAYSHNKDLYPQYTMALVKNGDVDRAIGICREIAADPRRRSVAIQTINLLLAEAPKESYTKHRNAIDKLIDGSKDVNVIYSSMNCHLRHGDLAAAEELCRRLVEINPRDVIALNNLAGLLADNDEDLQKAEKLIEKALSLAQINHAYLVDTKGMIALSSGRPDEAKALFESLLLEGMPDARYLLHLAAALQAIGDEMGAKHYVSRFLTHQIPADRLTNRERSWLSKLESLL